MSLRFIKRWLDYFVYKTNAGILSFLIGGCNTLFIALLSMAYHAVRTVLRDPVESLRYE